MQGIDTPPAARLTEAEEGEARRVVSDLQRTLGANAHGQIDFYFEGHTVNICDLMAHVEQRDAIGLQYVRHILAMEATYRGELPIIVQARKGFQRVGSAIRFILDNAGKEL